jgi:bifunctional DNA-binding transcriptional regulator/antitoxin component of YhaV-PrlF toxin-antitoxin module
MIFEATINDDGFVVIPDELLEECGIVDVANMRVVNKTIILTKPKETKNNKDKK